MTSQRARIELLEKRIPKGAELPIIFIRFCEGGRGAPIVGRIGMAHVFWVGRIRLDEGDTEETFVLRAYAMQAAQRPLEEMTDEEFSAAIVEAEEAAPSP